MTEDSKLRYFELLDNIGVDNAGNLEPLVHAGHQVGVPVLTPLGMTEEVHTVILEPADHLGREANARVIPDTRIVEVRDPIAAAAIAGSGAYREIDKPTKAHIEKAQKETAAHKDYLAKRDQQIELGNEPAPDADDHPDATLT